MLSIISIIGWALAGLLLLTGLGITIWGLSETLIDHCRASQQ